MVKKRGINTHQNSSALAVILLTIVITVLIASFIIFFLQKANLRKAEANLQNEITALKNQTASVQNKTEDDNNVKAEQAQIETVPMVNEFNANTDIKFSKCGVSGAFRLEKWYPAFTEKLKTINLVPKNVTSACYSDGGNMLIFIAQAGKYCEGPKVYRYNLETTNIAAAEVLNKGVSCLGSLKEFGKREGNIINAIAPGGDGGCRREEHYNYDFIKNTVELIKSRSLCDGDKDWKWTNY
jgi:mannitol-specific phosphotransferase system IIBC component